MMLAFLEGSFSYSLLLGILAAVNPCGFALLPTYLISYLSVDDTSDTPTRLRRSISVGGSVSLGFVAVFIVVGVISRFVTGWIEEQAKYAGLAIGLVLLLMGVRMLTGWRPRLWAPSLRGDTHRPGALGMIGFGVVYAVASIGCTIGLLTTAVMGSFVRDGFVSGIVSVALYGVGMGLFVTALTTTLAFAKGWMLRGSRRILRLVHHLSSVLMLVTGLYLSLYWYVAITQQSTSVGLVNEVGRWQTSIVEFLDNSGTTLIVTACVIVISTAGIASRLRRPRQAERQG